MKELVNLDTTHANDRHKGILELISGDGKVMVNELATRFQVTPETIRRDLTKLEANKLLKKIHGGAINIQSKFEREFEVRSFALEEKKNIATAALAFIKPGDTIFIDFGSTTYEFADQVKQIDNLTVITNSPLIANRVQENDSIEVILIGGQFNNTRYACLGSIALQNIDQLFADFAVLGAGAIHQQKGVMNPHIDEASMAIKMAAHSDKVMILADDSKWDKHAIYRVTTWEHVDILITSDAMGGTNRFDRIIYEGVNVVIAPKYIA